MDERARELLHRHNMRTGLLGLAGAVLLLAISRAQGAFGTSEQAIAPPVCSAWHRGQGDSHPIDLGRMKRSYEDLKARLSRTLVRSVEKEMERVSLKTYDVGLPACRRSEKRSSNLGNKIPTELLGKKLWFTRIEGKNSAILPALIKDDPEATIFVTRVEKFEVLAETSKALGRAVTLAPRDLAQALGVRCEPAIVVISKNGEVEIHENP